jgi:hypothetical protein
MRYTTMRRQRRRLPPCLPNDVLTGGGIEFDDDPAVLDLERRWAEVRRVGKEIADDWLRVAVQQLNVVTTEIAHDQLLTKLEVQQRVKWEAERALEQKYLDALLVIVKRSRDAWKKKAQERLDRATAEINRDLARRELLKFLGK